MYVYICILTCILVHLQSCFLWALIPQELDRATLQIALFCQCQYRKYAAKKIKQQLTVQRQEREKYHECAVKIQGNEENTHDVYKDVVMYTFFRFCFSSLSLECVCIYTSTC